MNTYTKKSKGSLALRKKLFSAAAMLLVASIMLVSTSYAWLVLSTAPEITGISTQVGANGALEIALLDTESYGDLTKVGEMDIDESLNGAVPAVTTSNLSWGNLVDLSDASYGLANITLNPSRLYITPPGADGVHILNDLLLKTPIYNEDGRITGLDKTSTVTSKFDGSKFPADGTVGYGVRAIGVAANMNESQLAVNGARAALVSAMSSARTTASNGLNANGNGIANIAVAYALNSSSSSGYAKADVQDLYDLAVELENSLNFIEGGIRQVYVAYVSTPASQVSEEDLDAAKATILDEGTTLVDLETLYPGVVLPTASDGTKIATLLTNDQTKVANARAGYKSLLDSGRDSFTNNDGVLDYMKPLVDYTNMTMGGYKVSDLVDKSLDELFEIVTNSGLNLVVPSGSGVLSDIADFAGDYNADVTVEEVSYGGYTLKNQTANMATDSSVSPAYLIQCSNMLLNFSAGDNSGGGTVITDFYGYALDFAVRTNVADSELLLQAESTQRIYSESDNAATQGGGSYMQFTSNAGLSASKMIKLMSALRVVFVDGNQAVLGIAALDMTLEQDDYTVLDATTQAETGKYAVLKNANPAQNSDYITKAEYDLLTSGSPEKDDYTVLDNATDEQYAVLTSTVGDETPAYISKATYDGLAEAGAVVINPTTRAIKAQLYLHSFSMTESDAHGDDDTQTHYTGGITLGEKLESNAIMALEENVPAKISAIVYLDGSFVNNSMVAAQGTDSMTGVLNLQFSSSANLMPMNNQALFDGEDAAAPPESGSNADGNGGENGSESGSGSDPAGGGGDDPADGTT